MRFLVSSVGEKLQFDSLLLDEQIIDSVGVLVLILQIEESFQFSIDDDELVPDNFNSIDALAELIEKKVAQASECVET